MSSEKEIGEISTKSSHDVQWTIQNIFSYTLEDVPHESSSFEISGSRWYLQVYPNGETRCDTVGWISLYLHRENCSSPPQGARFSFGLKRADGTVEQLKEDVTWVFDGKGYGVLKLLQRSELVERRSELVPSGALTVTCSLWTNIDSCASKDMLCRDLLDMFTSKKGCDATLKVRNKEFSVHKFILAARSPVFAAMFKADRKGKNPGVLDIADCDPKAFKEFLKYLYSGTAENLSIDHAFELYRIADKYGVGGLKSACLISIMLNLSVENVCDAIDFAVQFSITTLEHKTQNFFNKNFQEIVATARWETLLRENYLVANELLKNLGSQMEFTLKE